MNRHKDLLRKVAEQGLSVSHTRKGHLRIDTPNGPVFMASTPGDVRNYMNVRALLRRKGVRL